MFDGIKNNPTSKHRNRKNNCLEHDGPSSLLLSYQNGECFALHLVNNVRRETDKGEK